MCQIKSPDDFSNLIDFSAYFKDEKTCLAYIEQWRWKGTIRCSDCGSNKIYRFKGGVRFKCGDCKEYFSTTSGTIFASSKLPLVKWLMAMFIMSSHKRGISSCQLARDLGITQKSAWLMLHKIRGGLSQEGVKLEGIVSSDEAFVGGKNKNRSVKKKMTYSAGRNFKDKVPVLGMIEKGGIAKTIVLPVISHREIRMGVFTTVIPGSTLVTDEYGAYQNNSLKRMYNHKSVNHNKGQYSTVDGYSTNNIEGFWAHFKNMIRGVYYCISRKHLQKYCDEQTFRFNTRTQKSGVRFALLMEKLNFRLTYKQLVYGNS